MAPKGRRYNITSLARSVSRHLGFARRRAPRSPAMTITISAGIAGNLSSRARPRAISRWLLALAALVFLMVVIGDLTPLHESGLSLVRWASVAGVFPVPNPPSWTSSVQTVEELYSL